MAYFSIAVLLLSVLFLAYRHTTTMYQYLPQWLQPRQSTGFTRGKDDGATNTSPSDHYIDSLITPEVDIRVEEASRDQTTPKAQPQEFNDAVPSLSLNGALDSAKASKATEQSPPQSSVAAPSFPASDRTQRVSSMPPPPPRGLQPPTPKSAASLMPPPARPTLAPPPSAAASLRVPTTGPLPNRGPPASSQQRASGGLSPNGVVSTPNKRGKVLLSPGHSPMDWAALSKSKSLSGVETFQRVTPSMLRSMTGRKGKPAWSSWQGKVYNITPYIDFHPGGKPEIIKAAGRDGTALFMEAHPWVNWENMLESCLVGVMVPESYGMGDGKDGSLEDID